MSRDSMQQEHHDNPLKMGKLLIGFLKEKGLYDEFIDRLAEGKHVNLERSQIHGRNEIDFESVDDCV